MPGSNTSTLSTTSHGSEHDSTNSSLCYEEFENENDIVRSVLFSTRENVNVIHESFRQASISNIISYYYTPRNGCAYQQEITIQFFFQELHPLNLFDQYTTATFCHRNSSQTTQQNFMKLCR